MAANSGKVPGDQERLQTSYDSAAAEIKGDVQQLAAVWRNGKGPITKAEAGQFLWYHCYRGEDGRAEVVNAGIIGTCLSILDNTDASPVEKSTAAGILLTLCDADPKHKELVCKAKVGSSSACQVLHGCLTDVEAVPRHVVALLASLAGDPTCVASMVKALQPVPWLTYKAILENSCRDHQTAIVAANLVQALVTGRPQLAEEAVACGLLQQLVHCVSKHKSAAAVAALASCLQSFCESADSTKHQLGQIPGCIQILSDLLGPPPATIISWEQEQYRHILSPPSQQQQGPAGQAQPCEQPAAGQIVSQPYNRVGSNGGAAASRSLSKARGGLTVGSKGGMTLTSPRKQQGSEGDEAVLQPSVTVKRTSLIKTARSIRLEPQSSGTSALQDIVNKRSQHSLVGSEQTAVGRHARLLREPSRHRSVTSSAGGCPPDPTESDLPQPSQPLLCRNSTALKWEGPVPDSTRSAVAGVLCELVTLPEFCHAASDRLVTSRLSGLLKGAVKQMEGAGKPAGKKGKKSGKLSLTPEAEALLTTVCACMKFLVVSSNANCFRVAAAGCLPALVMLAGESKKTRLRQSAQAVLSQVAMLSEVQELIKQADVPEELWVEVPMKLVDSEVRQLMIEFPRSNLQPLDDVTARARK